MGVQILKVSYEVMAAIFQQDGSCQFKFSGMPEDARIVGCFESHFDCVALMVDSQSFAENEPGNIVPELTITIEEIRDTKGPGVRFREFL